MNISCHIKKLSLLLFIGFTFFSCKKEEKSTVTINEIMVRAPFDKPSIKIPDFSKSPKISILELFPKEKNGLLKNTLKNINVKSINFVSRIVGQKELPIEGVHLKNIFANTIKNEKYIHENVFNFSEE